MKGKDDYGRFNDEANPNGRRKFFKTELSPPEEEGEPITRSYGSQLSEEDRNGYIKTEILPYVPEADREAVFSLMAEVLKKYEGADIEPLAILQKAAKSRRHSEFIGKLDTFYREKFGELDPEYIRSVIGYDTKVDDFFKECYHELELPDEKPADL
ncbi:MAG TPA: hypothetical protein VJ485_03850 [archaeon]|nr:hypothetical protein [archaeon]